MPLAISAFAKSWAITGMTLSNQRLLREPGSRPIISIVHHRQLQLHRHVTCDPVADPACQVVSCRELLGMGRGPEWRLVQADCWGWYRRVGEATHPLAYTLTCLVL